MGLLDWLFGSRSSNGSQSASPVSSLKPSVQPTAPIVATSRGSGLFLTEVVGESYYQAALEAIAGGRSFDGVNQVVDAILVPEDCNPKDPNAVCVKINGEIVGYLSKSDAKTFRKEAASVIAQGLPVHCKANIRGGWDRGNGDRGHFGVWLDTGDE